MKEPRECFAEMVAEYPTPWLAIPWPCKPGKWVVTDKNGQQIFAGPEHLCGGISLVVNVSSPPERVRATRRQLKGGTEP